MKTILITCCALGLSACGSTGGAQFADFAKQVASDPRCGHTDRVQGNLGGVTGNNLAVYLERVCPPAASTSGAGASAGSSPTAPATPATP